MKRAPRKVPTYFTHFCGFEIKFHVAPLLSADERRQYVGNDKVVIYVTKEVRKGGENVER